MHIPSPYTVGQLIKYMFIYGPKHVINTLRAVKFLRKNVVSISEQEMRKRCDEHRKRLLYTRTEESIFIEDGTELRDTYFERCSLVNNVNANDVTFYNCVFDDCLYYKDGVRVKNALMLFDRLPEITNSALHI